MYLEVLSGAGIAGLAAFVWLLSASGLSLWRRVRHASPAAHTALAAVLVAWLVVIGHGLVDSFLAFSTTYLTFAMAAGLAFSRALMEPWNADAHRI
jgi:O-antigen ligase